MKIYFVRHGESEANAEKVFSGNTDVALTKKGIEQARDIAAKLKDVKFDHIYCSNLRRARSTADEILKGRNIEPTIYEEFREKDFGIFEGLGYEDIEEKYPEEWKKFLKDASTYDVPKGDTAQEFWDRVIGKFTEVAEKHIQNKDDTICIVCHGGVLMLIFSYLVYGNGEGYFRFSFDNCKENMVEYVGDYPIIRVLNG